MMPNVLFFIDFILVIILTNLFGIPWFLFPGYDITFLWRFLELLCGYFLTVLAVMFISWGVASLSLSRAEGKEIGNSPETSTLITAGVYAYCRHPITLGFIFATPGFALIFDLVPLLLLTIIFTPMLIAILPYEERELAHRFGKIYSNYRHSVPFLIPRCRKKKIS